MAIIFINVMNASNLAQAIEENIGEKVGLRWTVVDMGIKGPIPKEQRINARKKNKIKVKRLIVKLCGKESTADELPIGIRLRFVTLTLSQLSTYKVHISCLGHKICSNCLIFTKPSMYPS
jgi:hypothetical protein